MLFPYIYVNHGVEKLHQYIEHLVLEVWCKAKAPFDTSMLLPAFAPIVSGNKKFLLDPVTTIHGYFITLTKAQKATIADGFRRNNDVEGVCNGTVTPMRFEEITAIHKDLSAALNEFFKDLYYSVLKLSAVKKECGDLDDHYDSFGTINKTGKCPFCGLNDIKSPLLPVRDAYDHYMPKDVYPFNSVNFKNLVPACNPCNSSFKLAKDLLFDKAVNKTRKAFYPFNAVKADISFDVQVKSLDFDEPLKSDVEVSFTSATSQEETDAWIEVYGGKVRYPDKCKSMEAKYWLDQVLLEAQIKGESPLSFLSTRKAVAQMFPMMDYNFIRIPFLESCQAAGYIK